MLGNLGREGHGHNESIMIKKKKADISLKPEFQWISTTSSR